MRCRQKSSEAIPAVRVESPYGVVIHIVKDPGAMRGVGVSEIHQEFNP
jgi:hypothetical protein